MADAALLTANFDDKLKTYMLLQWVFVLVISFAGIPLLLFVPLLRMLIKRQFAALSCEMTEKFLKVRKGILVKVEKNVPLEQITDLGIVEGPLMRMLGIKQLSVETAGQSSQGPLVKLLAVEQVEQFRDGVLAQRDKLRKTVQATGQLETQTGSAALPVQEKILATLQRIEVLLQSQSNSSSN